MAMNFVTFNQDYSYLAVATPKGFRIFTTDPFAKSYETKEGNIAVIEMLFSTSLVALILSPRRLQITNTKRQCTICELTFPTTVLSVKLNRKRLVIVLEDQIFLYDIQTMKLLSTIDTSPNPHALCALAPSSDNCYMAYPLPQKAPAAAKQPAHAPPGTTHVSPSTGDVLIFDAEKLEAINVIEAHRSPLACITLNNDGTLLATASDKGTIIRVFSVPDGHKLYQFRRGSMPSHIYSMSFNITSTLLCVSSSTETIHLFKLTQQGSSSDASSSHSPIGRNLSLGSSIGSGQDDDESENASGPSFRKHNGTLMGILRRTSQNVGGVVAARVGGYLPKGVSEMWEPARDFAWFKLPRSQGSSGAGNTGPLRSVVAMSSNTPQVMVVTSDGNFYVFNIDLSKGGEGTLTKQYSVVDSNDRLGTVDY
ncbi:Autophagy-related protein 18 [Penicillium angulare]|uniref:Autophagy-related protein 18 n=1 Tax=Penicillium angulare TaxID=116970 RepID=UPI00253FF329|nr:Autophagy-related protein 18 [Penicillium angulare]KAJ5279391.1 Autophagy-related protein 18 [Penicillium angulare]